MSAYTTISPDKLLRLLGSPKGPALIDVRPGRQISPPNPRLIPRPPGASRRRALLLSAAVLAIFRFKAGLLQTLAASSAVGVALYLAGLTDHGVVK